MKLASNSILADKSESRDGDRNVSKSGGHNGQIHDGRVLSRYVDEKLVLTERCAGIVRSHIAIHLIQIRAECITNSIVILIL